MERAGDRPLLLFCPLCFGLICLCVSGGAVGLDIELALCGIYEDEGLAFGAADLGLPG